MAAEAAMVAEVVVAAVFAVFVMHFVNFNAPKGDASYFPLLLIPHKAEGVAVI